MANIGKWNAPSGIASQLTTELNSLATSTMCSASAIYDNSTAGTLNIYCDLEVNLAALSPTAGAYVAVYLWGAPDGTNFPAQSDADLRLTSTQLFCTIPIGTTASTAQRVVVRNLVLPPEQVKWKIDNQTGTALATSGNTMKIITYNINGNG
jgi:hypothetical protein